MEPTEEKSEEQTLADLRAVGEVLDAISKTWAIKRAESRELTLRLITDYGYNVSRAAKLSGHHRNTILIWLKIHNAGKK